MAAKIWLEFTRATAGTSTRLRVKQQEVPWRVLRGFPNTSGETLAHLNNISGGILDTDDLELRMDVNCGAWAQVTSTGATRIYRSRSPELQGRSRIDVWIGEDGFLEYLPDALIPYGGSRYEQTTRIRLEAGASLIWWDIVTPGREAAGEIFRYHRLASHFEILSGGGPLVEERWSLTPAMRPLNSAVRLGAFRHFATLYLCRAGAPAELWRKLESDLSHLAREQSVADELLWGASSLRADGVVLRGVAKSGRRLLGSLTALWKAAKPALCGRVAMPPRKLY